MILRCLGALSIVLLGVCVYGSTLNFPFVYDDVPNITQNGEIRVGGARGWGDLGLGLVQACHIEPPVVVFVLVGIE